MRLRWLLTVIGVLAVCALLSSCGYHAAISGRSARLPQNINTIYVPQFANKTATYGIDQQLTAAVVRELEIRTSYKVLASDNEHGADATLLGTVVSTSSSPLTYDSQTGRASSALAMVTVSVKLVDRNGKTLYDKPDYTFREQYEVSRELTSFFEEESPALDRITRDFSRQLVADVLEAF